MMMLIASSLVGSSACKIKEIEYLAVDKVDQVKLGFPNSTAHVYMKVYNPNSFTINLDSLHGFIIDKKDLVGNIENIGKSSLSGKDSTVLGFKLSIKTGGAALTLLRNLQSGTTSETPASTKLEGFGIVTVWGIKHKISLDKPLFSK